MRQIGVGIHRVPASQLPTKKIVFPAKFGHLTPLTLRPSHDKSLLAGNLLTLKKKSESGFVPQV